MKSIIENELFRDELDLNGYEGVDVTIRFNTLTDDDMEAEKTDTGGYRRPIKKKGQDIDKIKGDGDGNSTDK